MKRLTTLAGLAILALMLSPGEKVEASHRCSNCRYGSGMLAHFDFKDCHDLRMPGGFHCSSVDFAPVTVDAKDWK
ncbi:MAG: hypothetical protein ACJ71W_21970 [Terriglobales bacterium]